MRVFKTTADPFVGRLTYLRVLSGTLHSQAHVWNATRGEDERIGQLLLLHGKEQEPIGELKAGEIGAVAKLTVTETGDTLAAKEKPLTMPPLEFPAPSLVVAIEPQTKGDLDKMGPALQRMLEEEPTVRLERTRPASRSCGPWARPTSRSIMERLKRKFGAAIVTHTPKVPYKETIRGKTQVHGRYKKQTGGHGMFGDVWLELEPNPDGGVEFAERVVGGSVPKGFFAGRREGHPRGGGRGRRRRVSRCRTSGRRSTTARSIPSTRTSSRSRSRPRWRSRTASTRQARAPRADHDGRDPRARGVHGRGQPRPQRPSRPGARAWTRDGGVQIVTAHVPEAELFSYATELRSLTHGRGTFSSTLDHYDDVPSHIADKVIETHRKELEASGGHGGH